MPLVMFSEDEIRQDKMVALSPLVFNFRVCGWLGIGNQGALSAAPAPPPKPLI